MKQLKHTMNQAVPIKRNGLLFGDKSEQQWKMIKSQQDVFRVAGINTDPSRNWSEPVNKRVP